MTSTDFTFDTPHGPVRLEMRDPVSLNPAPRNVMKHSDPEIARLVGSIGAHGFLEVPLYNEQTDRIVAGHARREAAIANHMDAIPVFVGAWDATTEDVLTIALQGQQYGEWDDDALAKVLAELQAAEYDLDLTGLEPWKIEDLLGATPEGQDPNALWQGMPEFEQDAQNAVKQITVSFFSEDAVGEFSRLIGQTVTMGTKGITFPAARADFHSSAYVAVNEHE